MNYMKIIQKINTLDELNDLKVKFLSECEKRETKIKVSNILGDIKSFVGANELFESLFAPLMGKSEGKKIINNYVKTIKENKSLKTIYAYYNGLKNYNTVDNRKSYITEALTFNAPFKYDEYITGIGDIVNIIAEGFKVLGDDYIINNVKYNKENDTLCESLVFLSKTKKNIKNLNEYFTHLDKVSNIISETTKPINIDKTLEDIVSEMKNCDKKNDVNEIFTTENKEMTFENTKKICLEMISNQKEMNKDNEIISKLNEMEEKLYNKKYTFETFTKDMLYMSELQEVLK